MRRFYGMAMVVISLLMACSSSENVKQVPATPPVEQGSVDSHGVDKGAREHSAQVPSDAKSKAKAAPMRAMLGPFASIREYCSTRSPGGKAGAEQQCGDALVAGIDGPVEIRETLTPYRNIRLFAEGIAESDRDKELRCSLAMEVATGWYVLPALMDCDETSSARAQVLELALSGGASDRYLRLLYRSAPLSTESAVEMTGSRDHLVLCGPVKSGAMQCLPEIVMRSSIVVTTKTDSKVEKYLVELEEREGRVATTLKIGSLPAHVQLVAYALPFVTPPTLDGLALYRKHLQAGRAMSERGDFSSAVGEFEKALEASDGGRAQSELGYAAYRAGDLGKSIAASLQAADSPDPRLAAASLYNLGLAQEAKGQKSKALASFARSLALRPNQTVLKHGEALLSGERLWGSLVEYPSLGRSEAELLAYYEGQGNSEEDSAFPTSTSVAIVKQGRFAIVKVRIEDGHGFGTSTFDLATVEAGKYQIRATIGETEYGQEDSIEQDALGFEIVMSKSDSERVGDKRVTRLEYSRTREVVGGAQELIKTIDHHLVLCVSQATRSRCTQALPLGIDWSATLPKTASQLDGELFAQHYEKSSPVEWNYRLEATRDEGDVKLSTLRGLRDFEAHFRLWP